MVNDLKKAMQDLKGRFSKLGKMEIQVKKVKVSGEEREVNVTKLKLMLPFEKAWHFLDGKKRVIGATIFGASFVPALDPVTQQILRWLGGTIFTGGTAHAGAKASKYGSKGEFGSGELVAAFQDLVKAVVKIYNLIRRK